MTIREIVTQGLHYARTCKSLWLFGFFVGITTSGGSSGSGAGGGTGGGGVGLSVTAIALIVIGIVLTIAVAVLMRFVSEGALIEGVVRARNGGRMTVREGFRAGWAHWGVLLRITLFYFAAALGSLALLVVPCVIAVRAFGVLAGIGFGIPAVLVAVPWLITLSLVQAFASRIAVLENRRAIDAIRKARQFLHGRLRHGLRLLVAGFVGTLVIASVGILVMAPVGAALAVLIPLLGVFPVLVVGGTVLVPAIFVLVAMVGTLQSSIWTIGYVTQVES